MHNIYINIYVIAVIIFVRGENFSNNKRTRNKITKINFFAPDKKTKNVSALGVFIALVLVANTMGTVTCTYIQVHMYVMKKREKST